jgi:integrase
MTQKSIIGAGIDRVDGPLKVTGGARYAGDTQLAGMVYAVPVLSTIARGNIVAMDTQAAGKAPGVLTVITRENAPPLFKGKFHRSKHVYEHHSVLIQRCFPTCTFTHVPAHNCGKAVGRNWLMARTVRNAKLDSRAARAKLPVDSKSVHWVSMDRGRSVGYRKGHKGATWVAKFVTPDLRKEITLGSADDVLDADGVSIFNYSQAQAAARSWFEELTKPVAEAPLLLYSALEEYEATRKREGKDGAGNAARLRKHAADLLDKPISDLTVVVLRRWRDQLAAVADGEDEDAQRRARDTANRTISIMKSVLNLAADLHHDRISTRPWIVALKSFENVGEPRRVILTESDVRRLLSVIEEPGFRLLCMIAAGTGARYGEICRLTVSSATQVDKLKLIMPNSAKGKGRHGPFRMVPITQELAQVVCAATAGRAGHLPLVLHPSGREWRRSEQRRPFAAAVHAAGINAETTIYALRHSFISNCLVRGVPVRVIAANCDTSIQMIERHYSAFIADISEDAARRGLMSLGTTEPASLRAVS